MEENSDYKLYKFDCIIEFLLGKGIEIQWEIPYNIKKIPDDLRNLPAGEIGVEYWILYSESTGRKNLKITQLNDGKISGLSLERSILVGTGFTLEDVRNCIFSQ